MTPRPFIVHIIFRLDFGGLENGLVNLINNMADDKYRHAIICASDFTDFRKRIKNPDVEVYALHKKPGNDFGAYFRLWKLLRKLKPDIVHTRNLGTIEYVIPAILAGVKYRIHGEHGRDMSDIDGTNKKYILLRRFYGKFISRFIALSKDLEHWLINTVEIPSSKVVQLYNGVDLTRFQEKDASTIIRAQLPGVDDDDILIGTVGRLQAEKDQATLVNAFASLLSQLSSEQKHIKLLLIGDGPDREKLGVLVEERRLTERVIFLGARNDIPDLLSALDVFVLPSRGEGISNTILEAMASGLPVIATHVGGNPELVAESRTNSTSLTSLTNSTSLTSLTNSTGILVPPNDAGKMAEALLVYLNDMTLAKKHGKAGRQRVEALFSMDKMIENYVGAYDSVLVNHRGAET